MAAYRWVYDSRHLQADCQEPESAPEPYARQSSMGYLFLFFNTNRLEAGLSRLHQRQWKLNITKYISNTNTINKPAYKKLSFLSTPTVATAEETLTCSENSKSTLPCRVSQLTSYNQNVYCHLASKVQTATAAATMKMTTTTTASCRSTESNEPHFRTFPMVPNGPGYAHPKLPFHMGGPGSHKTYSYLGPPESTPQKASQLVQPFLHSSWL